MGFLPAMSKKACKEKAEQIRGWNLQKRSDLSPQRRFTLSREVYHFYGAHREVEEWDAVITRRFRQSLIKESIGRELQVSGLVGERDSVLSLSLRDQLLGDRQIDQQHIFSADVLVADALADFRARAIRERSAGAKAQRAFRSLIEDGEIINYVARLFVCAPASLFANDATEPSEKFAVGIETDGLPCRVLIFR
jgi:hypothetical protein